MSSECKKIAFFTYNLRGEYYLRLFDGFISQLVNTKYRILLFMQEKNKDFDIIKIIKENDIDGAIIVNLHLDDKYIKIMIKKMKDTKFVFLDNEIFDKNVSSVLIDNKEAVNIALKYFLSLNHKKIACIRSGFGNEDSIRFRYYREFLKENNIKYNENIVFNCFYSEADACREIKRSFLSFKNQIDSIFCTNDNMALGAIKALAEIGYDVPKDVSVIGFDDMRFSKFYNPSITTIHNPIFEIGKTSISEVIRLLEENDIGRIILLKPSLIKRNSCQKILKQN
ncbi:substrate-binding domain-containing protein [Clostridium sp. BJN0001]|uniref:LacI family DNA-binding transcriptional regulator n=1 Tax=Clostridium sp. BJN0001 TaxID=2930219 RepID=UPI001FD3FD52|nr:substrate-binding domain-containing protein [Clostridium sp. BJN0001]